MKALRSTLLLAGLAHAGTVSAETADAVSAPTSPYTHPPGPVSPT